MIKNSWKMFKASWAVLAADKELLIFPILSSIGVLVVTATFAIPLFLGNAFDRLYTNGMGVAGFLGLFLFYVVQYTVIFFANTALVGAALIRLRGGDPTVGDGMSIAGRNIAPILGFALIAATVGMLLRLISQKSRGPGRLIVSLIGMSWTIATYLVVPILAVEGVGPIEAIKRSVGYLKRTWGEQIVGNIGLGALFGLGFIAILLVFAPLFYLILSASTVNVWLLAAAGMAFLLVLVIFGLVRSTLDGIYTAAVYQYAVEGQHSGTSA